MPLRRGAGRLGLEGVASPAGRLKYQGVKLVRNIP